MFENEKSVSDFLRLKFLPNIMSRVVDVEIQIEIDVEVQILIWQANNDVILFIRTGMERVKFRPRLGFSFNASLSQILPSNTYLVLGPKLSLLLEWFPCPNFEFFVEFGNFSHQMLAFMSLKFVFYIKSVFCFICCC